MTVICDYCESVVEITGNHNCPFNEEQAEAAVAALRKEA